MTSTPTPGNGTGKSPIAVVAAAVGAMIGTIRHARAQPKRVDDIAGVNDFRRRSVRRRPVVLVHGTWCSAYDTWHTMAPALVQRGYPVFALDYGHRRGYDTTNVFNMVGGADIADSARELAGFVERVVAVTGSETVDLVGHSQGGTVAHQYLKFNGGSNANDPTRNRVRSLVTLGATNHGTTYGNKQIVGAVVEKLGFPVVGTTDATVGPSYAQQLFGSPFIAALNEHGDTVPGVRYTVVATKYDTVSTPPKATFLEPGEGAVVTNLWLQDVAPDSTAGHMELTTDRAAVGVVLNALDESRDRRQLH